MKATVKVLVLLGAPILFATNLPTSSQAAAMPQPVATPGTHGSVHRHTVRDRRHKGRAGVRHHSQHKRLG